MANSWLRIPSYAIEELGKQIDQLRSLYCDVEYDRTLKEFCNSLLFGRCNRSYSNVELKSLG